MKRLIKNPFFPLFSFLFLVLILPKKGVDILRNQTISLITPTWQLVDQTKSIFSKKSKAFSKTLSARVIYREPMSWSSHFWVNKGIRDQVAINAPVVIGKNVVGVVEEIFEKKSRVRLITDSKLAPSVRVKRGGEKNALLYEKVTNLTDVLETRTEVYGAHELSCALNAFKSQLNIEETELYLAKGTVTGSGTPLWRSLAPKLKGIGFNYDFTDDKGKARSLRASNEPLIKVGDLLVTSGLDGIFPEDLHVGIVTKIFPLREGGCSYELEAKPLISNLNDITNVSILSPL